MSFCSRCGYELKEGDVFCSQCGRAVEEDAKIPETDAASVQMTREESISLADKLGSEYEDLRMIRGEISNCQLDIRRCEPSKNPARYSAFRFFWPFLIAAMVSFWLVYFIGAVIAYLSLRSEGIFISEIAGFVVLAAVLIFGGSYARNKRDSLNMSLVNQERMNSKKEHDLKIRLDELRKKQIQVKKGTEEYNSLVPAALRNKSAMNKVKMYIQGGQADTFAEAIGLCLSNR